MTALTLPLLTALTAGFAHALEADHMAAVTAFVSRRPRPLQALGFGLRWGLGHSLAVVVVGGALILLDLRVPERLVQPMEFGVGAMLVGLGLWVLGGMLHGRRFSTSHAHAHEHGHSHSHLHAHAGATTWVGVAHGLAGTGTLLVLVPAALIPSPWLAGGFLLAFGVGTMCAMGLYALLAGLLFHHTGDRFPALGGALRAGTALASIAIGVVWMWGAAE